MLVGKRQVWERIFHGSVECWPVTKVCSRQRGEVVKTQGAEAAGDREVAVKMVGQGTSAIPQVFNRHLAHARHCPGLLVIEGKTRETCSVLLQISYFSG